MAKEVSAVGIWTSVSTPNAENVAAISNNIDQDTINGVIEDKNITMIVEEKGQTMTRLQWKGSSHDFDISFKFDEEFEFYDPYMKESTRNVVSKSGKVWTWMTYSKKIGTITNQFTIGTKFLVTVSILRFYFVIKI